MAKLPSQQITGLSHSACSFENAFVFGLLISHDSVSSSTRCYMKPAQSTERSLALLPVDSTVFLPFLVWEIYPGCFACVSL